MTEMPQKFAEQLQALGVLTVLTVTVTGVLLHGMKQMRTMMKVFETPVQQAARFLQLQPRKFLQVKWQIIRLQMIAGQV